MNCLLRFRVLALVVLKKDDRKYSPALRVVTWRRHLFSTRPLPGGASPP